MFRIVIQGRTYTWQELFDAFMHGKYRHGNEEWREYLEMLQRRDDTWIKAYHGKTRSISGVLRCRKISL